jgi:hypothetical protein
MRVKTVESLDTFQKSASALARELFTRALERPVGEGRDPTVQFLAGGGGSGKSSALRNVLGENNADITMDGTLSNLERARSQIEAALNSGRDAQIVYVYRSPEKAIQGAIQRAIEEGRPVPIEALARAHAQAPDVVKALANEYNGNDRVQVRAVWNDGDNSRQARFIPIEEIPHVERTQAADLFRQAVDAARAEGRIDPAVWRAFVQGIHRPNVGEGNGSLPPARPQEHAPDALTREGNPPGPPDGGSPDASPGPTLQNFVSAVARLLGREAPDTVETPAPVETPVTKADTPEQARALEIARQNPDAAIPTVDADGNPVTARAADLLKEADAAGREAETEAAAYETAVNCALRSPE